MKMKLYHFFVNRHAGIRSRYHKIHDNSGLPGRLLSYLYLLWLNFCYYILFCRFLGNPEEVSVYEEKRLLSLPESEAAFQKTMSAEQYVEQLCQCDVVSFDIFDTLIFRPFSDPTDLFFFLGERLGLLDLKRIRVEQEALARRDCQRMHGHYEVTLSDIWRRMERETGLCAVRGMQTEQDLELQFCYANPFMRQVFQGVLERGKQIIVLSDMYLPVDFLTKLLERNGYTGFSKVYVSCEYGVSKGDGKLYGLVRKNLPARASMAHVGDNGHSDVKMAVENGFTAIHYPNVNRMALTLRTYDMSPVVGGAYRGIVDNHLYQGGKVYSSEYEYGYVYGGLFVLGYCDFIHAYCESHGVDRILFLSRDGDILKQVYDRMYPGSPVSYVYWSRAAATKLIAEYDRYDFFRRYLYHKVNQGILVREILEALDLGETLEGLLAALPPGLPDEILTDQNVETVKKYFQDNWQEICAVYGEYREAAKLYFQRELEGVRRAVAVDIGWAGSGAMTLSYLAEQVWKFPCKVTGIMAGTNTIHNAEPDASEIFLQNGKLVSYLFSQAHNRDVMKRHDPGKDYNVFWELLLSSPTRQFSGFCFGEIALKEMSTDWMEEDQEHIFESRNKEAGSVKGRPVRKDTALVGTGICNSDGEVCLKFGRKDVNPEGMREIQRGILDFVTDYKMHFDSVPYMFHISGRDACAPMLLASGRRERYLKNMAERFALEKGV